MQTTDGAIQGIPQEFDRTAVVTIQGGGIYGLSVLGQLSALIYDFKIRPLALAGTSAGAIVATLFWAGYTPKEIRNLFIRLAQERRLPEILGPFEPPDAPFTFESLRGLKERYRRSSPQLVELFRTRKQFFLTRWGKAVRGFLVARSVVRQVLADVTPHARNLGLFTGEELERVLDEWIRSAPGLAPYAGELPRRGPLQFHHLSDLQRQHPAELYYPPLFLVTTNLTTRQLELINSIDPAYQNVPIARAVRASAGVPGFFRPVSIPGGPPAGWYVDGGMVSNFPAWVFSDEIRRRLARSPDHYGLVSRPWVHIGLRLVVDAPAPSDRPPKPEELLTALAGLATGQARNQLEDILASEIARSVIVRQPYSQTGGPTDMLALEQIDEAMIRSMFSQGAESAQAELAPLSFALPSASPVQAILEGLVNQAQRIFAQEDNAALKLRSNIYLPYGESLILRYSVHMQGDPDQSLVFGFSSGLTGWCFTTRIPLICNLAKISQLAEQGAMQPSELFGMTREQHMTVRPDRTWLASVPIFDPYALYPRDLASEAELGQPRLQGRHYHQLRCPMDGAVLGVLNLDAALPYAQIGLSEDPDLHRSDPRIQAIMSVMQAVSLDLGKFLSDCFAARGARA